MKYYELYDKSDNTLLFAGFADTLEQAARRANYAYTGMNPTKLTNDLDMECFVTSKKRYKALHGRH